MNPTPASHPRGSKSTNVGIFFTYPISQLDRREKLLYVLYLYIVLIILFNSGLIAESFKKNKLRVHEALLSLSQFSHMLLFLL